MRINRGGVEMRINKRIVTAGCIAALLGFSFAAKATDYYWAGASGAAWGTAGNWKLGSADGEAATVAPTASDDVYFTSTCTVEVSGTQKAKNIYLSDNAVVTLQRPAAANTNGKVQGMYTVGTEATTGDKIILNGVDLQSYTIASGGNTSWYADIEATANAAITNRIIAAGQNGQYTQLKYFGALSGAGNFELVASGTTRGGVTLFGDNSAFAGMVIFTPGYSSRNANAFGSTGQGSANARWIFNGYANGDQSTLLGTPDNETLICGSFEGTPQCRNNNNITLQIGGENIFSEFGATFSRGSGKRQINVIKTGTGTIRSSANFEQSNGGGILTIRGGKFVVASDSGAFGSVVFEGGTLGIAAGITYNINGKIAVSGTYPVKIEVEDGGEYTLSTAIAQSITSGGLEKYGSGTLTLSGANAYTGGTTVKEGALVLSGSVVGDITVEDGAVLQIPDSNLSTVFAKTLTFESGSLVKVDLDDETKVSDGTTLVSWASAPANGAYAWSDATRAAVRSSYTLVAESDGLKVKTATMAAKITVGEGDPEYYLTLDAATNALASAGSGAVLEILETVSGTVNLGVGQSVKAESGVDTTGLTVNAPTAEYASPVAKGAAVDGVHTWDYTASTVATTYTWAGGESTSWDTAANWTFGGDTTATRLPGELDSVVFASDATISLGAAKRVAAVTVNENYTLALSGSAALTTADNALAISGGGSIELPSADALALYANTAIRTTGALETVMDVSSFDCVTNVLLFTMAKDADNIPAANISITPQGSNIFFELGSVFTQDETIADTEYTKYYVQVVYAGDVYVWSGASDNVWGNADNWLKGGSIPALPPFADTNLVIIPPSADASMEIRGEGSYSEVTNYLGCLTICRDVTLSGQFRVSYASNDAYKNLRGIRGDYTLTLGDAAFLSENQYDIYCDVEVAGTFNNASGFAIKFHGDVAGDESARIANNSVEKTSYNGTYFYGAATNFVGTFTGGSRPAPNRDHTHFQNGDSTSERASWTFGAYENNKMFLTDGDTYKFGQYSNGSGHFNIYGARNVTVEIGALNTDSVMSSGDFGAGCNNILRKVGEGVLELNAANIANLIIAGTGTVHLAGANVPEALTLQTNATLRVSDMEATNTLNHVTGNGHSLHIITDERLQLHNEGDTFNGITNLIKSGTGTLTFSEVPSISSLTVLQGAVTLPVDWVDGEHPVRWDTSLCYRDTTISDKIVIRPLNSELAGVTLVWCGGGANDRLDNVDNWTTDGVTLKEYGLDEVPLSGENQVHLLFPENDAGFTVTIPNGDPSCLTLTIQTTVTFKGKGRLLAADFDGLGKIILEGTTGFGINGPSADCWYDLVVNGTNTVYSNIGALNLHSNIAGEGHLELTTFNHIGSVFLYGDNSDFAGVFYATNSYKVHFASKTSASENAVFHVESYVYRANRGNNTLHASPVAFGEFHGSVTRQRYSNNANPNTYVIGALGTASDISGCLAANDGAYASRADQIRKVGEGVLTSTATRANGYYIDEGTLYLADEPNMYSGGFIAFNGGILKLAASVTSDLSGKIKNSTAALKIDVEGAENEQVWASALAANNTVPAIEKYGFGTLVMTNAVPAWTEAATIDVEEGYIIVPKNSVAEYKADATGKAYHMGRNTTTDERYVSDEYVKLMHYDVAEVDGVVYSTLDKAYAASTNTANSVIYLIHSSDYELAIPMSGTFQMVNTNEFVWGGIIWPNGSEHLSRVVGTVEGHDITEYEAYDNSASTWTGAEGDGLWASGHNWSTDFKPNEYTVATIADEATIDLGNESRVAGTLVVEGDVGLTQSSPSPQSTLVLKHGDVEGTGTLTLGIALDGDNTNRVIGCNLNIDDTAIITNGVFTLGDGKVLTGEGTLVWRGGELPDATWQTALANSAWKGTLELCDVVLEDFNISQFGNAGSTVKIDDNAISTLSVRTAALPTLDAVNALAITTIAVLDEPTANKPLVKLTAESTVSNVGSIAVTTNGIAMTDITLKRETDGIYIASCSVTYNDATTLFGTYEYGAAFADANGVGQMTVLYGDGVLDGWDYDSGILTKNSNVARIERTQDQYQTLSAAKTDANDTDTITLFRASAENIELASGQTLVINAGVAYTGTISGSGTVVGHDDPIAARTFDGSWTGTYAVAGAIPSSLASTALGNAASKVRLDGATTLASGTVTITPMLDGASTGALAVSGTATLTLDKVSLADTPTAGVRVLAACTSGTGTICGFGRETIATSISGVRLVYDAAGAQGAGLYLAQFAAIGETRYNSLATALSAAAEGATVTLLRDPEETVAYEGSANIFLDGGDALVSGISVSGSGTLKVVGGKYSFNPTSYLAAGYSAYEDSTGVWTVEQTRIFKLVGSESAVYYYSPADAIARADGALVTQVVDTVTTAFSIGAGETLNLAAGSAQSLTGAITLSGGVLALSDGFAATITTLQTAEGTTSTLSGSGTLGIPLTVSGSGTVMLGGVFSGSSITISSGAVAIADDANLTATDVTFADGVTFVLPAITESSTVTLMTAKTITNNGITLDTSASVAGIEWGDPSIVGGDGVQLLQISPKVYTVQVGETKYETFAAMFTAQSATLTNDVTVLLATDENVTVPSGHVLRLDDVAGLHTGTISGTVMYKLQSAAVSGTLSLAYGRTYYTDTAISASGAATIELGGNTTILANGGIAVSDPEQLALTGDSGVLRVTGGTVTGSNIVYGATMELASSVTLGSGSAAFAMIVGDGTGDSEATLLASSGVAFGGEGAIRVRNGGTVETSGIGTGTDVSVIFDGGTLKATATGALLSENATIASKGMVVDSAGFAVTLDASKLAGASGVTAPKLTKKGAGVLTLTGSCPGLVITVAEGAGSVVAPKGTYTLGTCTYVSSSDETNDTLDYRLLASAGSARFATLQTAVDYAVANNKQITLLADLEASDTAVFPVSGLNKTLTIYPGDAEFSDKISAPGGSAFHLAYTAPYMEDDTPKATYTLTMDAPRIISMNVVDGYMVLTFDYSSHFKYAVVTSTTPDGHVEPEAGDYTTPEAKDIDEEAGTATLTITNPLAESNVIYIKLYLGN